MSGSVADVFMPSDVTKSPRKGQLARRALDEELCVRTNFTRGRSGSGVCHTRTWPRSATGCFEMPK